MTGKLQYCFEGEFRSFFSTYVLTKRHNLFIGFVCKFCSGIKPFDTNCDLIFSLLYLCLFVFAHVVHIGFNIFVLTDPTQAKCICKFIIEVITGKSTGLLKTFLATFLSCQCYFPLVK